jgi:hypothetical protein
MVSHMSLPPAAQIHFSSFLMIFVLSFWNTFPSGPTCRSFHVSVKLFEKINQKLKKFPKSIDDFPKGAIYIP